MADDRAMSPRYVREVILEDLDRQSGHAGQWTVEDRVIKGRDSWIFKARSPLAPFPLAVKVYCMAVEPEETVRQDELLRRYRDCLASRPDLSVPAPWAALPDHRALVMEWIEETRLDTLLQRAGRRSEERTRLIAAAGRWLRHFHDHSGLAAQPLKLEQPQRRIDLLLGGEDGAGLKVRDPAFRSAYAAMVRCAAEFAGTPLPHATAHGDFLAKNLLHGRRGTFGIDIGGSDYRPITRDIFRFLVQVEVEKPFLALASSGIEGRDAQAFLTAYGAIEHLQDDRLMTFFYLKAAMTQWARRINRFRNGRYRLHRVVHLLRLRQMAKHAVSALEARRR